MSATQLKTQAIADNAISTPKIGDSQITQPKLAPGVGGNADKSARATMSSATQSLPQSVFNVISLGAEEFDTDSMHDNVTNNSRLTVNSAGKYLFTGHISLGGGTGSLRLFRMVKNGLSQPQAGLGIPPPGANGIGMNISCILNMGVGDYVALELLHDSGGAINAEQASASEITALSGIRIAS